MEADGVLLMLEGGLMTKPNPKLLAPPWRERDGQGVLGAEYGPKTIQTYAKHVAQHRDWSFRRPSKETQRNSALIAWMEAGPRDVPPQEMRVYLELRKGHGMRYIARELELKRSSVKSYIRRLRERMTNGHRET